MANGRRRAQTHSARGSYVDVCLFTPLRPSFSHLPVIIPMTEAHFNAAQLHEALSQDIDIGLTFGTRGLRAATDLFEHSAAPSTGRFLFESTTSRSSQAPTSAASQYKDLSRYGTTNRTLPY